MKPSGFEYVAPSTLSDALEALDREAADVKVLAGGQSLVPTLNFRLANPATIVDINGLDALRFVSPTQTGIRIGALARHADLAHLQHESPVADSLRLIAPNIGHAAIRNRGTFCGSLAHADPASEWCVLAMALDATIVAESISGAREVRASEFFTTVFTTALQPSEILREATLPELPLGTRVAFRELTRRAGDFALVMAYAAVTISDFTVTDARIALGGVADVPIRAFDAEARLIGSPADDDGGVHEAAQLAARACRPSTDLHATAEYRVRVAEVVVRRALLDALGRRLD